MGSNTTYGVSHLVTALLRGLLHLCFDVTPSSHSWKSNWWALNQVGQTRVYSEMEQKGFHSTGNRGCSFKWRLLLHLPNLVHHKRWRNLPPLASPATHPYLVMLGDSVDWKIVERSRDRLRVDWTLHCALNLLKSTYSSISVLGQASASAGFTFCFLLAL